MAGELEQRIRAMKQQFIATHRQAPIVLYLTTADGLALRRAPGRTARRMFRTFLGLQVVWDAAQTRVE